MGSQNKSYRRGFKGIKYKGLCNDTKGRRSFESMVGQITQSRLNSRVKVKICSTMFLYSKKRWFIMVGSRLQETQPGHNKRQDTTTSNWRGN